MSSFFHNALIFLFCFNVKLDVCHCTLTWPNSPTGEWRFRDCTQLTANKTKPQIKNSTLSSLNNIQQTTEHRTSTTGNIKTERGAWGRLRRIMEKRSTMKTKAHNIRTRSLPGADWWIFSLTHRCRETEIPRDRPAFRSVRRHRDAPPLPRGPS